MTERPDNMAYIESEAKRTIPNPRGGVVIGTMPTKYPSPLLELHIRSDEDFIRLLPELNRWAAINLVHKMNADAGLTPDGEYPDIVFSQQHTQGVQ